MDEEPMKKVTGKISKMRSTQAEAIKKCIKYYEFRHDGMTKTQYLGTLVVNFKFCQTNLDDTVMVISLTANFLSAVSRNMLLKLRIASGDDKRKKFKAN
ncbi:unnamed protein product [Absidia cylindrospora]